jgi:hypothetical protein
MKRTFAFITSPPALLAFIAALAYGLLAPQLGFYWDDLPIGWIRYELGQEALARYFSTNRPAWGVWYGFLTEFIPFQPLYWQLLALFWRWLSALLFWGVFSQLFPKKNVLALFAASLFLLYPGFNQQAVSFVYGYHFTVYSLFLFSLFAMLWGNKNPRFAKISIVLGGIASVLNLIMGEYFFVLDLIRPLLLWIAFRQIADPKQRISRVFSAWLPYLSIFTLAALGRSFLFNNQIYEYSLLNHLRIAPLATLWELIKTILADFYTSLLPAWGRAFILPDFELQGKVTATVYLSIIFISFFVLFCALVPQAQPQEESFGRHEAVLLIMLGFFALLLAGVPFWLTGLPVSLEFPANRATLPFIFGSVFVLLGLFSFLPSSQTRYALLAVLIAFSAGRQFLWQDEFRRDWRVQKNLFWQMSWRIPALEEDTLLMLNEGALKFYADNSLSAPLNWIYAPNATAEHIPYMLFYPKNRLGGALESLNAEQAVRHDFIAGEFNGNTAQSLVLTFSPPSCLHVLDPQIDRENKLIADKYIRAALPLSDASRIVAGTPQMPAIYAPEPARGWCYFYEKADLARQQGEWEKARRLGEKAFADGEYPNDPTENFVFIEAYAHTADWANAEQLSRRANRVSPSYLSPMLCRLWERIDADVADSLAKEDAVYRMKSQFNCE